MTCSVKYALVLTLMSCMFSGCKNESRGCSAVAPAAIELNVFDFDTGLPVCEYEYTVSGDASLTGRGEVQGELCNRSAIYLTEGIYAVSVKRDGYEEFVSDTILVTKGACHIITETLDVDLKPL